MLDSLTVPRRAYDFGDYVDILRRNFLWIIAPAFAGLVISTVVAYMMPDTYVSTALIRVTPPQISPDLIKSTTSQDVAERISGMAQTMKSRTTLTGLINSYGLYKKELKAEPMEDVVDQMNRSIGIYPVGSTSASGRSLPLMQVAFAYSDRYIAQKVCADLVSRFMDLSSDANSSNNLGANQFISDEMNQAKRALDDAEQKLSDFQTAHAGRLPEEMQMNMQEMNALDGRLGALSEAANRNNEQRMYLENELHIAKDRLAAAAAQRQQVTLQNQKLASLDQQIADQQNTIINMRERYTEDYPDLQGAKDRLAFLQRQRDAAAKEKPQKVDLPENPTLARERMDSQETIDRINTQMKANAMEAEQISRDMGGVNGALRNYQGRMEGVPAGAKQYEDLIRDRDLAKQRYIDLEMKRESSNVSVDMESRKQGETLELLDAASLPSTPNAPNRRKIIPIGAFAGFGLGIVLVAFREVKDTSLKNLKDARMYTQLSILGSIPLLENDVVVQRRKQVMWVSWATATIAGLAIIAGSVAHYYLSKG